MMKLFFSWILILLFSAPAPPQGLLKVKVENVKETKGKMRIAIYRPSDNFPKKGSFKTIVVDANMPTTTIEVELPNGEYAVALVHDLNANGDMDLSFFGLPQEPYGISRNPSLSLSKPTFEESSFTLKSKKSISIELVHL